jgi:carnitine-CoA ligase
VPTALSPVGAADLPMLLDRLERRAGRPFLVWAPFDGPTEVWTYGGFTGRARELAAGLQARGLAPGDRVALVLDNSPEFLLGWTAVVLAGAVAVCLNPRSGREELAYYGRHAGVVGAFAGPAYAGEVGAAMPHLRWLASTRDDLRALAGDPADLRRTGPQPARPASIQYTSGTTARPKAVVWTHANCLWGGRVNAAHQGLTPADRYLVHLPLFHTNALSYSFLASLWAGATIVLQPRFSASRFWDVAVRHRCTWTSVVSFCVRALAARPAPHTHDFRGWGNSYRIPVGEGPGGIGAIGWFGMTETVSHPVCGDPRWPDPAGSMGRPAPEYGVAVVDDAGADVGPGEVGTLLVRGLPGVSLFAEYLGDPAATRAAYTGDGWFRTGDRVRRDPDGTLTFVERDKDVLKVGGENVGAPEIERVLLGVPAVREAAVVGRPHDMLGEVPVAFVLADGDPAAVRASVEAACAASLAPFKRPVEVRVVRELPRSTLEKVAKAELRRLLTPAPPGEPTPAPGAPG